MPSAGAATATATPTIAPAAVATPATTGAPASTTRQPLASTAVAPLGSRATTPPASTTELLDEVDALRRAGRRDQATAMLQRLAYDGSPTAAIAAFTLGRVLLDAPADPARATRAFERALHLGLPAGLSADAVALCRDALARTLHTDVPPDRCR